MGKLITFIAGLAVAVSAVMTVLIERHWAGRQQTRVEALAAQAAQIAQATTENARLTNLGAQTPAAPPLSQEQFHELIRLRNEVGQLNKLSDEKTRLEAANARLRAKAVTAEEKLAQAKALPNYWPKDQLAYAGHGNPDSALKSMLAAMKSGDLNAVLDCFDPAARPALEEELTKAGDDRAAKEAEIRGEMSDFLSDAEGFHIVDETTTGSNEVTINLSFDGEGGRVEKIVMKKFGDDWKFTK